MSEADPNATTLTLTLPADLAEAADRMRHGGGSGSTRAEALLYGFRQWASAQGLISSDEEALRPEELNSANDG